MEKFIEAYTLDQIMDETLKALSDGERVRIITQSPDEVMTWAARNKLPMHQLIIEPVPTGTLN